MREFFLGLLNMSISACWIVLAVVIVRLVLSKAPRLFSCLLWGLVGLRLILPISFESIFSLIPSADTLPQDIITGPSFEIHSGVGLIDSAVNEYLGDRYFEGVTVPSHNGADMMDILSVVWLIGLALMLLWAAVSYIKIRISCREAVCQKENIYICDKVSTPFILGIIKPRIYLPSSIDAESLEFVIAHEKAHIKRLDHIIKPLGYLLLSLHWFNPALWLAYILLCKDIEIACDEKVIKGLGDERKVDYSEALINCSLPRRTVAACPLAFGEVGVKSRIKSVLNYKKPAFWVVALAAVICVALSVGFLTNPVKLKVNDHDWRFTDALYNGEVIYCGEGYEEMFPNAEKKDISLNVKNSHLILTEGNEAQSLVYKITDRKTHKTTYSLTSGTLEGSAVVYKMKSNSEKEYYALTITIDNTEYNFRAAKSSGISGGIRIDQISEGDTRFKDIFSGAWEVDFAGPDDIAVFLDEDDVNEIVSNLRKIKISKEPSSLARIESNGFYQIILGKTKICISNGFYELWIDDGVKPSYSYEVLNRDVLSDLFDEALDGENPAASFVGTVLEVYEGQVLVDADKSGEIFVPLKTRTGYEMPILNVGDRIRVVFNGIVMETYPAQCERPFAIYKLEDTAAARLTTREVDDIYVMQRKSQNGIYALKLNLSTFEVKRHIESDNVTDKLYSFLNTADCVPKTEGEWVKFTPSAPNRYVIALELDDDAAMIIAVHFSDEGPYYIAIAESGKELNLKGDYSDLEFNRYIASDSFGQFLSELLK